MKANLRLNDDILLSLRIVTLCSQNGLVTAYLDTDFRNDVTLVQIKNKMWVE